MKFLMSPEGFKAIFRLSVLALLAIGAVLILYHAAPADYAFAFKLGSHDLAAGYRLRLFLFPVETGLIGILSLGLAVAAIPLLGQCAEELPASLALLFDRHRSRILRLLLVCLSLGALHALLAAQTYLVSPSEGLFLALPRWQDLSDGLIFSVLGMLACRLGMSPRVREGASPAPPRASRASIHFFNIPARVAARFLFLVAVLYPLGRVTGFAGEFHQDKLTLFLVIVELILASWIAEAIGAAIQRAELGEARRIAYNGLQVMVPMEFCHVLLQRFAWPCLWMHPESNSVAYDQFLFPHGRYVNLTSLSLGIALLGIVLVIPLSERPGAQTP